MASKRKAAPSQRSLEAEMRRLGKQLDALMASARSAEAGVRAKSLAQLRKLKIKQAAAQKTLAKLGRQSAAASGPLKAGGAQGLARHRGRGEDGDAALPRDGLTVPRVFRHGSH
ncbi:MAG: hypothetical protein EPO20_16930 [Betaproteobacteria bacterium]|nr:MAG: hypothetical protein EPO20_16930 [Betaproteobacteria bacterium]